MRPSVHGKQRKLEIPGTHFGSDDSCDGEKNSFLRGSERRAVCRLLDPRALDRPARTDRNRKGKTVTLHNEVECDRCGARVQPPKNHGWQVAFEIAPDGVNCSDVDGHLCYDCRQEFKRWRDAHRKMVSDRKIQ